MDASLDDYISQNKLQFTGGRRGGGRGRGGNRGGGGPIRNRGSETRRAAAPREQSTRVPAGPWRHDRYQNGTAMNGSRPQPLLSMGAMSAPGSGPVKLIVSNLDYQVSDGDIRELFGEFGGMTSAAVHFDSSGVSLGSAQVIYKDRTSANRAKQQYNGVHLDGRPMNISIDGDRGMTSGGGFSRPAVNQSASRFNRGFGNDSRPPRGPRSDGGRGRAGAGRGNDSGRSRGSGRGGRGGRSGDRPLKTAEELDAEMEKYLQEAKKKN